MKAKKILLLLLAAVLLFSTAACGSPNADDTAAVMAALEKFYACKSFTVIQLSEIAETVVLEGDKQVYDVESEKEISLILEPIPQMISSTVDRVTSGGESYEQATISCIVVEDGGYTEYFTDGSSWYKYSTDDTTLLYGIGAETMTASFYAELLEYRKAGEDNLDSGKAVRYEGRLSGEELVTVLEGFGVLSSVSSMSVNQQQKIRDNLVKDLDDVVVSIWVDKASGYPVRFSVNLAKVLQDSDKSINKTLGNKVSEVDWSLSDYTISMTVKDFDGLEQIVVPAAAANAQPYEE